MKHLLIAAAIAASAFAAAPAMATEAVPSALAQKLDTLPADFTWSAAAERRHEMMRQAQRQQRYGRGGYDRGPRRDVHPGYGRGPGYYGPGPGYRRPPPPPPPYGYGPRW